MDSEHSKFRIYLKSRYLAYELLGTPMERMLLDEFAKPLEKFGIIRRTLTPFFTSPMTGGHKYER